ncbi:hypothetical protein CRV06_12105, partial [Halarcobacter anaerophilus]
YRATVGEDGSWSADVAGSDLAADTSFEVSVESSDEAGNTVTTTGTSSHTVDVTTSDISKLAITDIVDNEGDYSNVTMFGTGAEAGNTISLYNENNEIVATTTVKDDGTWEVDISSLEGTPVNDNEFFSVTETDLAGNETAQTDTTHYWHGDWSEANSESSDDFIMTGSGDDTINTDDILSGTNENGKVTSTNDDTNDSLVIDGGDGNDTVTFGGNIADYTITTDSKGNVIVTETSSSDSDSNGIGDVTELRNIETIEFEDGTYDVGSGTFVEFDTQADSLTASIDVGTVSTILSQNAVVDEDANNSDGIYEKDGKYYQMQETSQIDTAALRDLGYTIDNDGKFYKINEDAPKVLVEQEMTREVTHVVDAEPIMKVATETTTFETLGEEFSHNVGEIRSGHSTTIDLGETTKNIELDFNNFNSGSLKVEFLDDKGKVIATRTSCPAHDGQRGYGFGEEFSAVRLTANNSDIEVQTINGRGLPETVTVEAGGLVPDYEAMEEAGINWTQTDYQVLTQSEDINNIGNVGNNKVNGFNPEDHELSQVFDFGPDMANRLVTITVDLEVKGSWDNNSTSTNDYFSVSANGEELDVNFYSSNGNSYTYDSEDVSYLGWDQREDFTYDYQVYLDENGQVQLDFMVASTASDENVNVHNIDVTYEGQSGWVKEETQTETYTESVLVDAPAEEVDLSEIPGGIPYISEEVEVEPNMTTEDDVTAYSYPVDISAALSDIDGSETLSVLITGVPEGATLSKGVDNGDGTWSIVVPEGDTSISDSLTITVLPDTKDFDLGIKAVSTESNGGDTNIAEDSDLVDVPDLIETPTLDMSIGDVNVIESSNDLGLEANGTEDYVNNSLFASNEADTFVFNDTYSSHIYTRGGDDTLTLSGNATNGSIYLGSGDDTLYVAGDVNGEYINTDSAFSRGDDTVVIDGKFTNASMSTGGGNDFVQIGDFGSSNINLGSGNDVLKLSGNQNDYKIYDNGYGNYTIEHNGQWTSVTGAEAIVFEDGNFMGNEDFAKEYINSNSDLTYEYQIDLDANITDDSILSNITLDNLPENAILKDSNGNEISANEDGTYTIQTDTNSDASITVVSNNELSSDSLNSITASITATNGDTSATVTVNDEGVVSNIEDSLQSATLIDGVVEGAYYETSSGVTGLTDENGNFNFRAGDDVTFSVGGVVLGVATAEDIASGQTFLQDIADVSRSDLNDEHLENMAVFLQSIDTLDSGDNIVITQAMRDALSDTTLDLRTASEEEVHHLIENVGGNYVEESDAMNHVQQMLEEYTDMDSTQFEEHIDDDLNNATLGKEPQAGVEYQTSSGINGVTDDTGSFDYYDGDSITFSQNGEVLSTIDSQNIGDDNLITLNELQEYDQNEIDLDNLELDFDNLSDAIVTDDIIDNSDDFNHVNISDMLSSDEEDTNSLSQLLGETEDDKASALSSNDEAASTPDNTQDTNLVDDYDPFKALEESSHNLMADKDMNDGLDDTHHDS